MLSREEIEKFLDDRKYSTTKIKGREFVYIGSGRYIPKSDLKFLLKKDRADLIPAYSYDEFELGLIQNAPKN